MEIQYRKIKKNIIVYINDNIDIGNSPQLEKDLDVIIREYPDCDIILNMENVQYMNSAGLGVLIITAKKLSTNKKYLRLCNLTPSVNKIINILNAHDIVNSYETEDEALTTERPVENA